MHLGFLCESDPGMHDPHKESDISFLWLYEPVHDLHVINLGKEHKVKVE